MADDHDCSYSAKMNLKKYFKRNKNNDSTNQLPSLNGKKEKQIPKYLDNILFLLY